MEGLFLLFGEFIGAVLAPVIAAVVEFVVLLVSLCVEGVVALARALSSSSGGITATPVHPATPAKPNAEAVVSPPPPRKPSKVRRRILIGMAVLFALTLGAVLLANFVFFRQTLRFCLGLAEKTNGISVSFTDAEGSLFRGEVVLTGVTARREGHPSSNFDLDIDRVDIALRFRREAGMRVVERLHITGLTGRMDVQREGGEKPPRKPFIVRDLLLEKSGLTVATTGAHGPAGLPVVITRWEGREIRSRTMVFGVLFRCTASGTLAGRDFLITSEERDGGRVTRWKAEGIPIGVVGAFAGGVFSWLREGELDVDVQDQWRLSGQTEIDMDWKLRLRNVKAEVPEGLPLAKSALVTPVVAFLNEHGRDLPLDFQFVLNENEFSAGSSAGLTALWNAFSTAAFGQIAEKAGVKTEAVRELFKGGVDVFKDYLDRKRQKKSEDADPPGSKPEKKGLLERLRGKNKPAGEAAP